MLDASTVVSGRAYNLAGGLMVIICKKLFWANILATLLIVLMSCSGVESDQRSENFDDETIVQPAQVSGAFLTFENSDVDCNQTSNSETSHNLICQLVVVRDDGTTEIPTGVENGLVINWTDSVIGADVIKSQACLISEDLFTFECDIETTVGNVSLQTNVALEKPTEEKLIIYTQTRSEDGVWTGNSEITLGEIIADPAPIECVTDQDWFTWENADGSRFGDDCGWFDGDTSTSSYLGGKDRDSPTVIRFDPPLSGGEGIEIKLNGDFADVTVLINGANEKIHPYEDGTGVLIWDEEVGLITSISFMRGAGAAGTGFLYYLKVYDDTLALPPKDVTFENKGVFQTD